jgi:hypothetical protein
LMKSGIITQNLSISAIMVVPTAVSMSIPARCTILRVFEVKEYAASRRIR